VFFFCELIKECSVKTESMIQDLIERAAMPCPGDQVWNVSQCYDVILNLPDASELTVLLSSFCYWVRFKGMIYQEEILPVHGHSW